MRPLLLAAGSVPVLAFAMPALAATPAEVVDTYASLAQAAYDDSLSAARDLQSAVESFLSAPSPERLSSARAAWIAARVPYPQTEVFRFGNPVVDDWEGKVNAWPLDEGLIDYVDPSYGGATDENALAALNVIGNPTLTIGGQAVDASEITPALLADTLDQADGVESNVARGYHAVEFLLWGQDLNGHGPGAGDRPWTDYAQGAECTNGNCERRAAYLRAATQLLVDDLDWMTGQWAEGGSARAAVTANPEAGLGAMVKGMGSLSYGELAGERMRLGLMLNDPEEEQDCFSDNTPNSHYYDGLGIQNVYLGRYVRTDGSVVEGPLLRDLVAATDPALDAEITAKLAASVAALGEVKAAAEGGLAYDAMLEAGNAEGERLISAAVDALVDQTHSFERAIGALGLGAIAFEGSDSLDSPDAVFQ
ncbi:Iron-regulated protein A precursor [Rubellimicrobium mesophilum DSM 19309]|uniref:Iron-regulated protein A n=1 Tax=Rubellimicrobium mesophilum DSM 19309 TaxID=442562 RepID=A0A017HU95_9RHOB|nr:imelysin family protein [Rubellimicrobium mesophilum]EYD77910.1 Iron-regulated protein A precursor [Rubellimicrobium mesophilum DSM 19309]